MIGLQAARHVAEPQIVFITSISSRFASITPGRVLRGQGGLSMVAQLFAARLAGQGIRVYEVRPGLIETDMTQPVHDLYDERIAAGLIPIRRWGTPEDVGRAVAAIAARCVSLFHRRRLRRRRRAAACGSSDRNSMPAELIAAVCDMPSRWRMSRRSEDCPASSCVQ